MNTHKQRILALATLSFIVALAMALPGSAFAAGGRLRQPEKGEAAGDTGSDPVLAPEDGESDELPPADAPDDGSGAGEPAGEPVVEPEPVAPLDALTLLAEGWTKWPSTSYNSRMVEFAIEGSDSLTGYLGVGSPGTSSPASYLGRAAFHLVYDDGDENEVITYAYSNNDLSTSEFLLHVRDFGYINIGAMPVVDAWTKTTATGYTSLLLRGEARNIIPNSTFEVMVIMTPQANGQVEYRWSVTFHDDTAIVVESLPITPAEDRLLPNTTAVFMIDTEVELNDNLPIYSLGPNAGMFIESSSGFARVTFPAVPASQGGPVDYAASYWSAPGGIERVFGANLNVSHASQMSSATGTVLLQDFDSAVFFRYATRDLYDGQAADFVYTVGLGLGGGIDEQTTPGGPTTPDTGDVSALPALLAIATASGLGAVLAVRRRRASAQQAS